MFTRAYDEEVLEISKLQAVPLPYTCNREHKKLSIPLPDGQLHHSTHTPRCALSHIIYATAEKPSLGTIYRKRPDSITPFSLSLFSLSKNVTKTTVKVKNS